nr:rhodanese-like domain-containing protein [uncultured Halomonas sp.]
MKSPDHFFPCTVLALTLLFGISVSTVADDATQGQVQKIEAQEAYELLESNAQAMLVDVRDPIEIKFTGFATPTDIHVPLALADRENFDEGANTWAMVPNPDFDAQIQQALVERGVDDDTPIVFMCRSGSRSDKAAERVAAMGFNNVHSMDQGFEGSPLEKRNSKGVRAVDGWRNSGLPWSYEIDPEVAWRPSS